jgi:YD repeat-containing protein
MTCRQEDGLAYLQTWDAEKRLALVENLASDELTTFTYDGDGALVKRVANGETIVYAGIDHRRIQSLVAQKLLNAGHPAAGVHGAWSSWHLAASGVVIAAGYVW